MRIIHKKPIINFILYTLSIFLFYNPCSGDLKAIAFSGKVRINGEILTQKKKEIVLNEGDQIRTGVDSYIELKGTSYFLKVYSYSKLTIAEKPILHYGKISQAVDKNFLDLQFAFYPRPMQGRTVKVMIRTSSKEISISGKIRDEKTESKLPFYPGSEDWFSALSGFDIEAPPKKYWFELEVKKDSENYSRVIYPFYLIPRKVEKGKVYLGEDSKEILKPSERKLEEIKELFKVLSIHSLEIMWDKRFFPPLIDPVIISGFGKSRTYYISGVSNFTRYHRGIDFKAERGEAVLSPSRGTVVLAKMRLSTGNTVVIDHGQGVFSLFFHLDSIEVKTGDVVEAKQRIGGAGSTGLSGGVHLHWSVVVNGIYVDPLDWVKGMF